MNTDQTRRSTQLAGLRIFLIVTSLLMLLWMPASPRAQYGCPPPYWTCSVGCDLYLVQMECTTIRCTPYGDNVCDAWTFWVLTGDEFCFDVCGYLVDYICQCFA